MSRSKLRNRCPGTSLSRAFTLIEMLVTIAILGMLIGILVPSLSKARKRAKDADCLTRIRSLYVSHITYLHDNDRFPPLNNEEDDGAWQYNYLIYDGRDFEHNFGPLIADGANLEDIEALHCPVQTDVYHLPGTPQNPWPTIPTQDTRASYARRYHLSGKTIGEIHRTIAVLSDLMHVPEVIKSGHKTGLNAVYSDGHGRWVRDPGDFTDNDLESPFDMLNNEIVKDLWKVMDEAR